MDEEIEAQGREVKQPAQALETSSTAQIQVWAFPLQKPEPHGFPLTSISRLTPPPLLQCTDVYLVP